MIEAKIQTLNNFIRTFLETTGLHAAVKEIFFVTKNEIVFTYNNGTFNIPNKLSDFPFLISICINAGKALFNRYCPDEKTNKIILEIENGFIILINIKRTYNLVVRIQKPGEIADEDFIDLMNSELDALRDLLFEII